MAFLINIFLIWRIGLFIFAWFGEKILPFIPRFPYSDVYLIPSGLPNWIWSFANFDGVHYLTIAKSGYSAQFTQVFFPLYPVLLGLLDKIFSFLNPIINGLLISNLCFIMGIYIFSKLLLLDYKSKDVRWIILFLIFIPASFYFGSLYTESLFFLLIVSSFYAARKKKWRLAGILGGLASATRLVGIFLLPALLWEWQQEKLKMTRSVILNLFQDPSKMLKQVQHDAMNIFHSPILYLVPLGLVVYMIYLQLAFGDFLYFWHVQPIFGAERSGSGIILLPQVFWRYGKILTGVSITKESFWIPLLELVSTIGAVFLLFIAHLKKIRLSYLIFSWFAVLTPTLTGTLSSMPRYILVAFPLYITLGLMKNSYKKILLLSVFCFLLFILTLLFTRGHWVS